MRIADFCSSSISRTLWKGRILWFFLLAFAASLLGHIPTAHALDAGFRLDNNATISISPTTAPELVEGSSYNEAYSISVNCATQEEIANPNNKRPLPPDRPYTVTINTSNTGLIDPPHITPSSFSFGAGECGPGTLRTFTLVEAGDDNIQAFPSYQIRATINTTNVLGYSGVQAVTSSATRVDPHRITLKGDPFLKTSEKDAVTDRTSSFQIYLDRSLIRGKDPTDEVTPNSTVFVIVTSDDASEGLIYTDSQPIARASQTLAFTPSDPFTPQTVYVQGVDDLEVDGDVIYKIKVTNVISDDPEYNNLGVADGYAGVNHITIVNQDDESGNQEDLPGVLVTSADDTLNTSEDGTTDTFRVRLNSRPRSSTNASIGTVRVTFRSSRPDEASVAPSSLTFNEQNWNINQLVTVTGVDDALEDGAQAYRIITKIDTADEYSAGNQQTNDPNYQTIDPPDVNGSNADNDTDGFVVTPISLAVAESDDPSTAGTVENRGTFSVSLTKAPSSNVTIPVSSADVKVATVNKTSLTFTPANYNTPQIVTVTAFDDNVDRDLASTTIVLGTTISTDTSYNNKNPDDVSVEVNTDNDTAGITVTPVSGLTTTEAGGSATFTVVLDTQPSANVIVPLSVSNNNEASIAPTSLTFTPQNYNTPQPVTITGKDDNLDDGDMAYTVITGPATGDAAYRDIDAADVAATNTDDDSVAVIVTPTSGLQTTEAGGKATFTINLGSKPTASVRINLSSSDTTEGTVSTPFVSFDTQNFATPQTVTVTGVDDNEADGNVVYKIITSEPITTDVAYDALTETATPNVAVTNIDDDTAGITVSKTSITTSEAGGTDTFTVVLGSRPTSDVTISVASSDSSEGKVDKSSLVFTSANYNTPQIVTVTGRDDLIVDGNKTYTITTGAAQSTDANYNNRTVADVAAVNTDDDSFGLIVSPASLVVNEAGSATFTVKLNAAPTDNVTFALSSGTPAYLSVSPTRLTFTSANYNTPQTVTVTAANESDVMATRSSSVIFDTLVSQDSRFNGVKPQPLPVSIIDNDSPGITVTPTSGLTTSEGGGQARFSIRLNAKPTTNVVIPLSVNDTTEGTVQPVSLTFTTNNYNVAQFVTVTGKDDKLDDGDVAYLVITGPATGDAAYQGIDAADVAMTNTDDETSSVIVKPTSGLTTTEAGTTDTFTVELGAQPTDTVTVALSSSDTNEGTVSPSSLTFTPANYGPQTVTVKGVADNVLDADKTFTIITGNAVSNDTAFNGLTVPDVTVVNKNTDQAAVLVSPTGPLVLEEGNNGNFQVRLNQAPTKDVFIDVKSSDGSIATVNKARLQFTPTNFSTPQYVSVRTVEDRIDYRNIPAKGKVTIELSPVISQDASYNGIDPQDVKVTVVDNDIAGVQVTPLSGLVTTEAGGTATFSVRLRSQPLSDVTLDVSSSDATEGKVSTVQSPTPATTQTLTFTPANFNTLQVVTVTGQQDGLTDGNVAYKIVTNPTASTDPNYQGFNPEDVSVTNTDTDRVAVIVTPQELKTSESVTTDSFSVRLGSQPTQDVTISVTSGMPKEGTVSKTSLTFTPTNYNTPQTVVVTGVDDPDVDGDKRYSIVLGNTQSTDPNYNGLAVPKVKVVNADNDVAGVTVTPVSGLVVTENRGTATFQVSLISRPTSNVTLALSSTDTTEGRVDPTSLTFTPSNYNVPQTATVTGIADGIDDGDKVFFIVTGDRVTDLDTVSDDPNFNGLSVPDVKVTNTDRNTAAIVLDSAVGLVTGENGLTDTFTVKLASKPSAGAVTLNIDSSDTTEGTVLPTTLVFTDTNYSTPQTVTITGKDDVLRDGDVSYIIRITTETTSTEYQTLNERATAVNRDNDVAGVTVTPRTIKTNEDGKTATFSVRLTSQPEASVEIALSGVDSTEGKSNRTLLIFTPQNYDIEQVVTVAGVDDSESDGDITYTIFTSATQSQNALYNAIPVPDVVVINEDNDVAGVTLTPTTLATSESGTSANFTARLKTRPTADVVLSFSGFDTSEGRLSKSSLTFTPSNYSTLQTVTVTGIDDVLADGPRSYVIKTTATSASPQYNGSVVKVPEINVTNADNESAAIIVTPTSLKTTEGGSKMSFVVRLSALPVSPVSIVLTSGDNTEGQISLPSGTDSQRTPKTQQTIVLNSSNYSTGQTVFVHPIDDDVDDDTVQYRITGSNAVSNDPAFNGRSFPSLLVSNDDNDTRAVIVSPLTGYTTEAGGKHVSAIRLASQPTADVTFAVSVSDNTEASVTPSSITFTPDNWESARAVAVTGKPDGIADGSQNYTVNFVASSSDPKYNGLAVSKIALTNFEAGVSVTEVDGSARVTTIETTESGKTASFKVALSGKPKSNVSIAVSSSDTTEATVAPATLTFTPDNYNTPQTVVVTGVNDQETDGNINYRVRFVVTSTDAGYDELSVSSIAGTNRDDDIPGVSVSPSTTLSTTEAGGDATFKVELNSRPTVDVVIDLSSSNTAEGTISPTSLTFTPENWNTGQTVTVTGVDDVKIDGDIAYSIVTSAAKSTDANYSGRAVADVKVINIDNDSDSNTAPDDYSDIGKTYALSVPYADGTAAASTTTAAKAFTVPPVRTDGVRNYFLYRFDATTQQKVELGNTSVIRRGEGYLLVPNARGASIRKPEQDETRLPTTATSFSITLRHKASTEGADDGWNLIGFPFDPSRFSRADWLSATVRTKDGRVFASVQEAADEGVMEAGLFTLDEGNETPGAMVDVTTTGLLPFEGYYVRTIEDGVVVTLQASQ